MFSRGFYVALGLALSIAGGTVRADEGGIRLGATRVIYTAGQKEATLSVINTSDTGFLVQSWTSDIRTDSADKHFIITPPLYRQAKGTTTLRVLPATADFPADRESAYWLTVKTIPVHADVKKGANIVQFAYAMKIKLFYRPQGLKPRAAEAYKALTFSRSGDRLVVKNPTPYYITFNSVKVGGREIKDIKEMVPPLGSASYALPGGAGGSVTYKTINDFGGLTPEITTPL